MAAYSELVSKHATLSGTTVDSVTLTKAFGKVEVLNRGTGTLYVTTGNSVSGTTDPTAAGDDTTVVPAGACVELDANGRTGFTVKIIGNGDAYSVQGVT